MLRITNTLTGKLEEFVPIREGNVHLYVCGPTVYGLTHVGNARPALFFNLVRNYLKQIGYKVSFVSNYTDVDDKIINRAREEKTTSKDIAETYTVAYRTDMDMLGVAPPDQAPKVTENIPEIIELIKNLVAKGKAYEIDGEVFYSVRGFPSYGKLSGKHLDDLIAGARVEANEKKRDPLDFSLWKPQKKEDEPAWDSPWGKGRPGWHIECSAMAMKYLGETLDIHGGGLDLIHPHHENEIAQSEGASSKPFSKYWMHVNLVTIESAKMSKSVGNIFLNRDFVARYTAETLRYLLLSNHYRSPVDFSRKHIADCMTALHRVYTTKLKCERLIKATVAGAHGELSPEEVTLKDQARFFSESWHASLNDDFNMPRVVAQVFDYIRLLNGYLDKKGFRPTQTSQTLGDAFLKNLAELGTITGLFKEPTEAYLATLKQIGAREAGLTEEAISKTIQAREAARKAKNFQEADALRNQLLSQGIELQDTPSGTLWDVNFGHLKLD